MNQKCEKKLNRWKLHKKIDKYTKKKKKIEKNMCRTLESNQTSWKNFEKKVKIEVKSKETRSIHQISIINHGEMLKKSENSSKIWKNSSGHRKSYKNHEKKLIKAQNLK